jgi:hypothetical protein
VDPRDGLDILEIKKKTYFPCRDPNPESPSPTMLPHIPRLAAIFEMEGKI